MAIDPTAWAALLDDDGSNTVGSIWNKAAIKSVVLDPALQTLRFTSYAQVILPGAANYNDLVVPNGPTSVPWLFSPAASMGVTGITAEPQLTQHLLINATGNTITFYNQNAQSLAANRIVGPGYSDYTLGVWASIWTTYVVGTGWILHKAS